MVNDHVHKNVDVHKPDAASRPHDAKGQVEKVWENAMTKGEGHVIDPSGVEITWDRTKPRGSQWHMGHIPQAKYSVYHKLYMENHLTKQEFLDWYHDPMNYRPELPKTNMSHEYE